MLIILPIVRLFKKFGYPVIFLLITSDKRDPTAYFIGDSYYCNVDDCSKRNLCRNK